jgi:hypothetical protein
LNDAIFLPITAGKKKMAPGTVNQAHSTVKNTATANLSNRNPVTRPLSLDGFNGQTEF